MKTSHARGTIVKIRLPQPKARSRAMFLPIERVAFTRKLLKTFSLLTPGEANSRIEAILHAISPGHVNSFA